MSKRLKGVIAREAN